MNSISSSLRSQSPPRAPGPFAVNGLARPPFTLPAAPPTALRMPSGSPQVNAIPSGDVSLGAPRLPHHQLSGVPSLGAIPSVQTMNGYPQQHQQQQRSMTPHRRTPREGEPSHHHHHSKHHVQSSPDKVTGPALASVSAALENAEEHRSLRQAAIAATITSHLRHTGHSKSRPSMMKASMDSSKKWFENDPDGAGPVTLRSMHNVVQTLRREPTRLLPAAFVSRVLADAEATLQRSRSAAVQHLNLPSPTRLVLVGDTHGQLADVLWIFLKHGLPSKAITYLFNGDVADRGSHAIEIFVIVLGFLAVAPEIMHMNRGNHEDETMNHGPAGGFYDECLRKYGAEIGGFIFDQMRRIYALLPIATVIGQGVFVVHGGLSRAPHFLNQLESLHHRSSTVPMNPTDAREQALVDAMWSDPSERPGLTPSSRGDSLVHFGPDITQNFLRETGFSLIIRSHEVPPNLDGVYYMHGNRLITLFSASNYCGSTGNQGAVLVFSEHNGKLSYDVSRHFAPALDSGAFQRLSEQAAGSPELEQAATHEEVMAVRAAVARDPTNSRLHGDVLGQVARLIVEHKAALWSFFFRHDVKKTGFVEMDVWLQGCLANIGDYPWQMLEKLLVVEDKGQVDYITFLQRFRVALMGDEVSDAWADELLSRVYQRLLNKNSSFTEYINMFDRNGDGVVSIQELHQAFADMDVGITRKQASALMRTISSHASSIDKGGQPGSSIDINSFLSRFEMVYHPLVEHRNLPPWVANAMKRIGRHLWAGDATDNCSPQERGRRFFETADTSGDGRLSYKEFTTSLQLLFRQLGDQKLHLSEAQLNELATWVDINRQGSINYLEFLANFSTNDCVGGGQAFQVDIMEHICTVIWCNKPALLTSLLTIDVRHSGEVTKEQLAAALRAMNHSLDPSSEPLTDEQIELLVDHTRFDPKTGKVRYQRFLNSFQVFDTANAQK